MRGGLPIASAMDAKHSCRNVRHVKFKVELSVSSSSLERIAADAATAQTVVCAM